MLRKPKDKDYFLLLNMEEEEISIKIFTLMDLFSIQLIANKCPE